MRAVTCQDCADVKHRKTHGLIERVRSGLVLFNTEQYKRDVLSCHARVGTCDRLDNSSLARHDETNVSGGAVLQPRRGGKARDNCVRGSHQPFIEHAHLPNQVQWSTSPPHTAIVTLRLTEELGKNTRLHTAQGVCQRNSNANRILRDETARCKRRWSHLKPVEWVAQPSIRGCVPTKSLIKYRTCTKNERTDITELQPHSHGIAHGNEHADSRLSLGARARLCPSL